MPEEKENLLSQELSRPSIINPPNHMPISSPRRTPSRSASPNIRTRQREPVPSEPRVRRIRAIPPKFYTIPHNRVAEEGETVRFQCAISGHPEPWVVWQKNNHVVTPSSKIKITEKEDVRTLEISDVTTKDSGIYKITLENEVGKIEASARLDVIAHRDFSMRGIRARSSSPRPTPTYRKYYMGSNTHLGGSAMFFSDLRGLSAPYVKWYKNGQPIEENSKYLIQITPKLSTLQINNVENKDVGVYKCIAVDHNGNSIESEGKLNVDDVSNNPISTPKLIYGLPEKRVVTEGSEVRLQLKVESKAEFDVVWMKDGCVLPQCDDFQQEIDTNGIVSLFIPDVYPEDGGDYRCEIYSLYGEVVTKCALLVEGK